MSNCAIVGINWGDEGKGRMVDLIARDYDIVCRYQGGNNAGHTIVNEYGKFALHLIPSGICLPGVVNVLGNGVVIDLESLCGEIEALQNAGVPITPENFKISERATIVFPYHRALDGLEEARLKDKKYGSTLRGIAPVYSDKYQKKTIMMGELLYPAYLEKRLASILEWKNLTIQNVYGAEPYKLEDMLAWCREFGSKLAPYICDTSKYLYEAEKVGKSIMFEAQLGALRDIDFGIYPYTSSSSTIAAYAPIGAGIPAKAVQDCFVAGQLDVAAEQGIGKPQQRVEPVDRQQGKAQRLPPVVTPRKMRPLMREYILPLHLVQTGGQVDAWFYNAEDERRGNGIAKINVILNGERHAHAPTQPKITHERIEQHGSKADEPHPARKIRPHIKRVDAGCWHGGKMLAERGIHSIVDDLHRYSR